MNEPRALRPANNAAKRDAATNPSSRSINPPWPGMRPLESLTPNRRLSADSNRSPNSETIAAASPSQNNAARWFVHSASRRPRTAPPNGPYDRPGPSLTRRDARPKAGASDRSPGEIGRNVRSPNDREKPQNRSQAEARTDSQEHHADDQRARIERACRGPDSMPPSGQPADRDRAENEHGDGPEDRIVKRKQRGERKRETAGRDPLGEPRATDEPLPFPEDDNRCEPPENGEDNTANPRCRQREASHRHSRRHARLEVRTEPSARRRGNRWTLSTLPPCASILTTPT